MRNLVYSGLVAAALTGAAQGADYPDPFVDSSVAKVETIYGSSDNAYLNRPRFLIESFDSPFGERGYVSQGISRPDNNQKIVSSPVSIPLAQITKGLLDVVITIGMSTLPLYRRKEE